MINSIKPAQRVRIGVEAADGQILQFFSYVKKVSSDRLSLVFSPSKEHFVKYLKEGSPLKLSVYTPLGILLLDAIVINEPVNFEFEVCYDHPEKRIQRRRYVRAKINCRMIIDQAGKTYTVLTEDIGGGGVRFLCDTPLALELSNVKLFIPEIEESLSFSGIVEKKQRFKPNEYLIEFVNIKEEDRNKIIRKCLALEALSLRGD